MLFAAAALFVKFKLENFRASVERDLESQIGAQLAMGTVSVNGFRGLRIENLEVGFGEAPGLTARIKSPVTFIHINLNDLLYGDLRVERIVLDDSIIHLEGPPSTDWIDPDARLLKSPDFQTTASFRITGTNSRLRLTDPTATNTVEVTDFEFDIGRLTDANQMTADLRGFFEGERAKPIAVKLSAVNPQDFDLRIHITNLQREDLDFIFPASEDLVIGGRIDPTLWVNGRPGSKVVLSLHAPFTGLELRDQPDFVDPADGLLTGLADYDLETQVLQIHNAHADSTAIAGDLSGSIWFAERYPTLDLTLTASQIPTRDVLNDMFANADESQGTFAFSVDGDESVQLTMHGTTDDPVFLAIVSSPQGVVEFTPKNDDLPLVALELQTIEARWDPSRDSPLELSCSITNGMLRHDATDIHLSSIFGAVSVREGVLRLDPGRAIFHGNPVVASGDFNIETQDLDATFSGVIARLEDTRLHDSIPKTVVAGAATVDGKLRKRGDTYEIESEIDLTQTEFDYLWWFSKPAGIGTLATVNARLDMATGGELDIQGEVASSQLSAHATLERTDSTKSGWHIATINATSSHVDVNSIAKCLNLPYEISGGTGTEAFFDWTRTGPGSSWDQQGGLLIDSVILLADVPDVEGPVECQTVSIDVRMSAHEGSEAFLTARAESASLPKVGGNWIVPLQPPPGWEQKNRLWNFDIAANRIEAPPWSGRQFAAQAYTDAASSGFHKYSTKVGEGYLEGSYHIDKATNELSSDIRWQNIPTTVMLDHLGYDHILEGAMTGDVHYTMDRDNPLTLVGDGQLDIRDGKFSADYLYSLLRSQAEDDFVTLPPNLAFNRVQADVTFEGDRVATPKLILDSPAFYIDGKGHYIRDGDLDYMIAVAIDPRTAREIPLLADNFNLDGIQLSQQRLDLAFRISGPTFNPTGELAQLPPASVTLVSGALQVANEAAKVVDLPRRVLIGLLKTGGGIVGP